MSNPVHSIYNIRMMDDMARGDSWVHQRHPLAKLTVTVAFIAAVISFDKAEISSLLPFLFYPLLLVIVLDIPAVPVIKRIMMVEPFIIVLGMFNPILDRQPVMIGNISMAEGWLTFLSLFIKCSLTVAAVVMLVASTGMEKLAASLRMLRIPRIFVLQLLLTYRYISLLAEEAGRLMRAHALRTPGHKGIVHTAWGSLAGGLLLRSFDRAQRVYQAMCLRGFDGEYNIGQVRGIDVKDAVYAVVWLVFFTAARLYDLPVLLGSLLTGVF